MRLGYHWTEHLSGLWSVAKLFSLLDSPHADESVSRLLESLAILDLGLWVVGRRSKPMHLWAKWCCGRPGIEPTTALPRSLIDLIATACLDRNHSAKLLEWSARLQADYIESAQYHIWKAYAIASSLYLRFRDNSALGDADILVGELKEHISGFRSEAALDPSLNPRLVVWPAFIAGKCATDSQTTSFVKNILNDSNLQLGIDCKSLLKGILEETWARVDAGELVTACTVAREHNLEIGIW